MSKELSLSKKISIFLISISLVIGVVAFSSSNSSTSMIDKTVVKELDIHRYLGTWYEIARYDHRFERGLVGVTATYSMREDGKIKVLNSGYKESMNGEYSEAVGKARIPDPENEPAKLRVSFFWFFYADYYVLELDTDYQWAIVGSRSDKYLWVLSRTPEMDQEVYLECLDKITKRGYNISELIKVEQKGV